MRCRRSVITGLGVISPIGVGQEAFWAAAVEGRVGTGPATQYDTAGLSSDRAGEVRGLDDAAAFRRLDPTPFGRAARLGVAAAREAVRDARLADDLDAAADRLAVVMGIVVADRSGLEPRAAAILADPATPFDRRPHDGAMVADAVAVELGARGLVFSLPTACAAGNGAIGAACDLVEDGLADVALAGGADSLSPAMVAMFSRFDSLAPDVVRPFDRHRRGLILSEGAAVVVVEAEEHARARGATIYGRLAGHANFADAHDMTHPHPEGLGARLSMAAALREAGVSPTEIDWVCAHGTGTPANDPIEARAILEVFGATPPPASSLKAILGHAQGAAGAIEAVACLLAMRHGVVPPTMNHGETDPACPIDVVPNRARRQGVAAVMNNAFGFGGNISCGVYVRG